MKKVLYSLVLIPFLAATASADFIGAGAGFVIPDNSPAGVSSSINVNLAPDERASEVSVILFGLEHTWVGDLTVTLSGPGGSVDLMNRTGRVGGVGAGDSSDLSGFYVFSDTGADWWDAAAATAGGDAIAQGVYAPSTVDDGFQSFKGTYNNTLINGNWTLTISDNAGGDLGTLDGWSLSIRSTPIPEPVSLGLFGMAVVGLAGCRRRK